MFKRILLATDLDETSAPAFKVARQLARKLRAEIVICHVFRPLAALAMAPRADELRKRVRRERLVDTTRRLHRLEAAARRARIKAASIVVSGSPAAAVVRAARQATVDMVVVGTHGRTGLGRILVGSVADEVVRRAPCPVLVVRAIPRASGHR